MEIMKFKNIPLSTSLPSANVNIEEKKRSNFFNWRGQFSPQLIEEILLSYATEHDVVFDPFLGSGTVLFECALLNIEALGSEINPAAIAFAKMYELINHDKNKIIKALEEIDDFVSKYTNSILLCELFEKDLLDFFNTESSDIKKNILMALITGMDFGSKKLDINRIIKVWNTLYETIKNFPVSKKQLTCYQCDSRKTPLKNDFIDFVVTSPPYINVFNYHQNYRKSVEMTGADILKVAKSEIGANRKFRQNRFLTVVQYCMDMALVFKELYRVCKKDAKIIFIVGRESKIKGTAFKNADLVSSVAILCGFTLEGQQERVFLNKFGELIFEEILRFTIVSNLQDDIIEMSREIGRQALKDSLHYADSKVFTEISEAYEKSKNIIPSPLLEN
jgi:DNA modification methylase